MRKFLVMVVVLMLCACPVWADSTKVPVNFAGQAVAMAEVNDSVTYLPLRLLSEHSGAVVQYDAAAGIVNTTRPDGVVLTLRVGDQCYARDGVTYVPLRYVAENLLCDVNWHDGEVWIEPKFALHFSDGYDNENGGAEVFWLNFADAGLYCFDMERVLSVKAATLPLADYRMMGSDLLGLHMCEYRNMSVSRTAMGNLVVSLQLFDGNTGLSAYGFRDFYAFIRDGEAMELQSRPWQRDGLIYATDTEGALMIDETSGEVKHYPIEGIGNCRILWMDEGRVLLGNGNKYFLLQPANGEVRDLMPEILSEDNRIRLLTMAGIDADQEEAYWANLNNDLSQDAHPQLMFRDFYMGNLRFKLTAAYTWDEQDNWRYFMVEIPLEK